MINKDNAKQFLPIIKALTEGKTVQYNLLGRWVTCIDFDFNAAPSYYRIKPEPQKVRLSIVDVQVGDVFKFDSSNSVMDTYVYTLSKEGRFLCVAPEKNVGIVTFSDDTLVTIMQPNGKWEKYKTIEE